MGTVIIVEGDGVHRSGPAVDMLGRSRFLAEGVFGDRRRGTKASEAEPAKRQEAASAEYRIPRPYTELFRRAERDGLDVDGDGEAAAAEAALGSEEWSREFWRAARAVARTRLGSSGPDPSGYERRVAELHESLWVEELGVRLELHKWRATVDRIPSVKDRLFSLDISDLFDELSAPLDERGLLRGVRLLIRCSAGGKYWASVQPGSGAGTLLLSGPDSLARAQGPYDVEFHPLRFQQTAMHRALDGPMVERIIGTTLPNSDESAPQEGASCSPAEQAVEALPASLNEAQRRAVAAALEVGALHPLVVWGPPGTGKSTLAAFIIWHLVQQRPTNLHILVAAPSNTGADVLCAKLAKLGLDSKRMLRLNALGRSFGTVPEPIQQFSYHEPGEDGRPTFAVPPLPQLRCFKVVVTTCICAAHMSNALRKESAASGWFSHVLVDEAGEATEPETLVALALLRPVAGRALLLGDHFQLGPLVLSSLANELGRLESSMIERLANERFQAARAGEAEGLHRDTLLECEDRGLFFLTESYRSHPHIMALYSRLFYSDQLEHRQRQQQSGLMSFFQARGLDGPVLLHNVVGAERRDAGSASVYNVEEVRIVQQYLVDLMGDESLRLVAHEIGVITPYARQVRALERQIDGLGPAFAGIQVGTVERFQGQERRAIILSTVRCSRSRGEAAGGGGAAAAVRRPIGFLADKRRLNVAVSRAVAGLIIVGDWRTLARHSPQWRALLKMGQEAGYLRGEPLDGPDAGDTQQHQAQPRPGPQQPRAVPAAEASAAWDALTGGS